MMWLAAPAFAASATLMVFGDSLSSAYGLPREQGWVSLMEKRLHERKPNYKVANVSISGETTAGGRSRIGAALKAHRPAIVILALGANDGLRGLSLDAMRANLETIIRACRAAGARVLLVGMRMPPNYGPAYSEKFQSTFRDLAQRERLPLVPFLLEGFADDRDYFQPDGIHPAAQAQPRMLDTVWKALQPLL
ncbi:MAG: arylesterase [Betaproteobacteria bacterium]|nr:arylesterase [Betaproteobacteria bacterium]